MIDFPAYTEKIYSSSTSTVAIVMANGRDQHLRTLTVMVVRGRHMGSGIKTLMIQDSDLIWHSCSPNYHRRYEDTTKGFINCGLYLFLLVGGYLILSYLGIAIYVTRCTNTPKRSACDAILTSQLPCLLHVQTHHHSTTQKLP